ncbi:hypothetical protein PF005_g25243 [Phytophthora fragariae]|uniref:Uncharacterized protein n=1 Tax=Phytophthora fragariae TaxID=53985 RepID=A0A6A3I8I2_9STRA|nr:hypothetical protein PF003_g4048 [Phytophthora fragariae]KAE8923778.1 hypothetical protein PF009_g25978 [Phytophthora fragariae]KAE8976588.1 hypothetical protein PF011_g23985 [Phytophthora fragariae]KAE9075375.1 hypothetical protein PF010_g24325 [Phytophthora fragariae]KAE9085753.1 hypothetical protein PF007_g21029 [Phytophthora fragariae]
MADASPLPAELFRLYPDALSDSHAAAYALLVVAPLTALASRLLLYRGKSTTPLQVYIVSLAVPALAVLLPMWYWPQEKNVYRMLTMSRAESLYHWSQKYAFFRKHFQAGHMSSEAWHTIDTAYDNIYNDNSRFLYDFWGPGQEMSLYETQVNVGLFYVLWIAIIYAVTTPKAAQAASKMSFVGLVALLAIEVTVRLTRYDPVIKEISPFTTPREYLLWGHRFFPILVFTVVSIKKVFYVDLEKHHQRVLIHMLEKNMETVAELQEVGKELMPEAVSSSKTPKK